MWWTRVFDPTTVDSRHEANGRPCVRPSACSALHSDGFWAAGGRRSGANGNDGEMPSFRFFGLLLPLLLTADARYNPFGTGGDPLGDRDSNEDDRVGEGAGAGAGIGAGAPGDEDYDDGPENPFSIFQINRHFHIDDVVYGDILLSPEQKLQTLHGVGVSRAIAKRHGRNRWPNNVVHYDLSNRKSIIHKALANLQSQTCFKFKKRSSEKDYVHVDKKDGCYSVVGRQGGRQIMSLGDGCILQGTVQHEFLHALGIQHEHQRPDRDKYLKVNYKNLERGMRSQVEKIPASQVDLHGIKYDYKSIMHYDATAFGKRGKNGKLKKTLVPLQKGVKLVDNQKLSASDLKRLSILGGCSTLPSLAAIHLEVLTANRTIGQLLVDSLPDRITRCKARDHAGIAALLSKRTAALESFEVADKADLKEYFRGTPFCTRAATDYAQLFRLKCPRIAFDEGQSFPTYLHEMEDCGPFDRNEHVQEIRVSSESLSATDLPALRHLRGLNDRFKLIVEAEQRIGFDEDFEASKEMRILLAEISDYIPIVKAAGFGASGGNDLEFLMSLDVRAQNFEDFVEEWRAVLDWKPEDSQKEEYLMGEPWVTFATYSFVHDGVRVFFAFRKY
ncbi:Metalloendopeptidase [Aphelenchoides fujianensis]|nr:Metalloendopeptidase [Aphelenchoides fujianensis]